MLSCDSKDSLDCCVHDHDMLMTSILSICTCRLIYIAHMTWRAQVLNMDDELTESEATELEYPDRPPSPGVIKPMPQGPPPLKPSSALPTRSEPLNSQWQPHSIRPTTPAPKSKTSRIVATPQTAQISNPQGQRAALFVCVPKEICGCLLLNVCMRAFTKVCLARCERAGIRCLSSVALSSMEHSCNANV